MIIKSENMNKNILTRRVDFKGWEAAMNDNKLLYGKHNNKWKPTGCWVSVNLGWEEWCEAESFSGGDHTIDLKCKEGYFILVIDGLKTFMKIWRTFLSETDHKVLPEFEKYKHISMTHLINKEGNFVDFWKWVKEFYKIDAIYLTYAGQVETRMDTFMYGWDCESMCVFTEEMLEIKK